LSVFVCTGCGAELTAPLSQVVLPVHARQAYGNGVQLPVLMAPGTFAVDPESWGRAAGRPGAGEREGSEAGHATGAGAECGDGAEAGSVVVAPGTSGAPCWSRSGRASPAGGFAGAAGGLPDGLVAVMFRRTLDATLARPAAVRGPWPRELSGRLPRHVRGGGA